MADSQVFKPLFFTRLKKFLLGHYRKRTDARTEQLSVMIVVVIMRPFPDIRWRYHVNAEYGKQHIGYRRLTKYRMMLVIMKYDKYS